MSVFNFDKIILSLDDRDIKKIIRETNLREFAMALMTADTEVRDKILGNMSKLTAAGLQEMIEGMVGPAEGLQKMRECPSIQKDIEKVRRKIISIIHHLCDIGDIVLSEAYRFSDGIINHIEDACKNKRLSLSSRMGTTEEVIHAFAAFQNRRDELVQIQELDIDSSLLQD